MAEITQAARDYLTAVAKKKEAAMARGGQAAADAFVKTQTDKAKQLSGDDSKFQTVAQSRLRNSVKAKPAPVGKKPPARTGAPMTNSAPNKSYKPKKPPAKNVGEMVSNYLSSNHNSTSADKKAENARQQKAYEAANAARAARRDK